MAATAARATADPLSFWMAEEAPLVSGLRPALAAPTATAALEELDAALADEAAAVLAVAAMVKLQEKVRIAPK